MQLSHNTKAHKCNEKLASMMNVQAHLARFQAAHLRNANIRSRRPSSLPFAVRRRHLEKLITMHSAATPTAAAAAAAIIGGTEKATDRFHVMDFHHVEFWCADAATAAARFSFGLGVRLAAQSDLSTGNTAHASRLLRSRSGSLAFLFTAPYAAADAAATASVRSFNADAARRFTDTHGGLAVRAVAVRVADAAEAFFASVDAGARPAFAPADLGRGFGFAEVELSGDTVLRFVSYPDGTDVSFLPGFQDVASSGSCPDLGLTRFDHVVVNIPELAPVAANVGGFTGFHRFWEFTADEVCTAESGINGVVLANDSETVLLTLVEPVLGTRLPSHVETFLEHHGGPGVQHLAISSDDVLGTLREIRARSAMGGFELLPPPPASYYDSARRRVGDLLPEAQMKECQELGVMVDRGDDNGIMLQIFTKPAGDRPTLLLEFVQRIGCMEMEHDKEYQRPGCGGFGKRNVTDLLKSIEDNNNNTLDPAASSLALAA
uniref:Uncharacterized protein n=1 Tax=Avena sativa TaxID=4498 RepID=A0ACD5ZD89_AVESA